METRTVTLENGQTRKIKIDLADFPNLNNAEIVASAKKVYQAEDFIMSRHEEWEEDRWREWNKNEIIRGIINCARCHDVVTGDQEMNDDPWSTFRKFESIILRGRRYEDILRARNI